MGQLEHEPVEILIVDDRAENLMALQAVLSEPGYALVCARSGTEALKQVLRHDFALILLDVLMPGMDGFETARLIRQRQASQQIPIIFLTATGNDVSMIYQGYAVGGVDYLVKPIDPAVVKAKVAVFVDLHRKTQRIRAQEERLRALERGQAAEALRQSETQYETTFREAAVGIAHVTSDGQFLRVNSALCDALGYTADELCSLRLQDVSHPEDTVQHVLALHSIGEGRLDTYRSERRYLHQSGRVVWMYVVASPLRTSAGETKHIIVIAEDTTQRRDAADRQTFLAAAGEALLSTLDVRQGLRKVCTLAVPRLAQWCAIDLRSGEDIEEVPIEHAETGELEHARQLRRRMTVPMVRRLLAEGGYELRRELMIVPIVARGEALGTISMGSTRAGHTYGEADLAMAEELARRAAFALDNARLFREAREAIRVRDEFLSIASHELRTPLTPLQLQLQMLLAEGDAAQLAKVPIDRLAKILHRSERQVVRLAALIDNLLDVSRITSGRLRLEPEIMDLAEVVRDVAGRFEEELGQAGCELSARLEDGVSGRWDRLRVEQLVTNLLSNAVKYGSGKPIEIELQRDGIHALLVVEDHGIGIPEDRLGRIFDRFERAVSPQTYGGLGLGLYIARQILEAHGGTIEVKSKLGLGSRFEVRLPLAANDQPTARPPSPAPELASARS